MKLNDAQPLAIEAELAERAVAEMYEAIWTAGSDVAMAHKSLVLGFNYDAERMLMNALESLQRASELVRSC